MVWEVQLEKGTASEKRPGENYNEQQQGLLKKDWLKNTVEKDSHGEDDWVFSK